MLSSENEMRFQTWICEEIHVEGLDLGTWLEMREDDAEQEIAMTWTEASRFRVEPQVLNRPESRKNSVEVLGTHDHRCHHAQEQNLNIQCQKAQHAKLVTAVSNQVMPDVIVIVPI